MMRGLNSWQTSLADLSLILFLVIAGTHREELPDQRPDDAEEATRPTAEIALGQPMAVYRPGGDADLGRWLARQDMDNGEVATVVVRHEAGAAASAATQAADLAGQIETAGYRARLMVEPAASPEILVVIAHDRRNPAKPEDGTKIAQTR